MKEDQWPGTMTSAPGGPVLHTMGQHSFFKDTTTAKYEPETAMKGIPVDDPWSNGARLPITVTDDCRYEPHDNTVINSNHDKINMISNPDTACSNEHLKVSRDKWQPFAGYHDATGNQIQNMTSASIPNILRSDLDRLKSLQRFASQQARSVEELTKRHRKLDHLQRCLKRYEIERFEAGQAVRRIEDRLKELHHRTADLLSTALTATVADPCGPSSARSSQIVRKPSKHRSKYRPLRTTANQMYVEAEHMLSSTPQLDTRNLPSRSTEEHKRNRNTTITTDATESTGCEALNLKSKSEESPTMVCPCSAKQVSLAQKRIAELEARHNTLVEHLNLQRSRLAAADATVVSLARTLLQFTVKSEAENVADREHLNQISFDASNGPNGLSDNTKVYLPHANPFYSLANPIQGSLERIPQKKWSSRNSIETASYASSLATDYSTIALSPTAWNRCSAMPIKSGTCEQRLPQHMLSKDATVKNANEYIHLSTTESALPVCETEDMFLNPGSHHSLSDCNQLPNYFTSFNRPSKDAVFPALWQPYFAHPRQPPPPLPPKPMKREHVRTVQPAEEEVTTMEDEEVSHFMSHPKENRMPVSIMEEDVQRMESCGTQRPPPPPYYVNLFGSEVINDAAAATAKFVRMPSREPKSSEERHGSFESHRTQQLCSTPTKTPDTVIERSKQTKRDFPSQNSFADMDSAPSVRHKNAPTVTITNFYEYLNAMGHDLNRLTQDKPGVDELSWSGITTPASSCFNSKVIRWIRSSLPNGATRNKPRHHSLDDRDSATIRSVWQRMDELRILLTENQCEGFLWIQLFPQSNGRMKMRPWRTLRASDRSWTDSGVQSGCDSPNPTTNQRCTPKWRNTRWIRAWFVCNIRDQSVWYQEQGRGDRIKGSFRFSEVRAVEPGLVPTSDVKLNEDTRPHHQSDTDGGSLEHTRPGKQTRSGSGLFHRNKTRTLDWTQESEHSLRQTDELNELAFRVETWMQVYTLKAANVALRNLWMDVFNFAIQSARR